MMNGQDGRIFVEASEIFYNIRLPLSETTHPTRNLYFIDVSHIHYKLIERRNSEGEYIRLMAMLTQNKLERFALVSYPRYEMVFC